MRESIKTSLKTGTAVIAISGLTMSGVALAQTTDETVPEDPANGEATKVHFRGHHRGGRGMEVLADLTGLTMEEIAEEIGAGATIAQMAAANGSSTQEYVDAVVTEAEEHLAAAVADERLTQEEADEKLAELTDRVTEEVNEAYPFRIGRRIQQTQALAEVLGLTVEDLAAAKEAGTSLSDLASQQGVAVDDIVAVLIAPLEDRLDGAVADERLTQEEADEKLADATERITEGIESGDGFRAGGGRGGRGPGRGGPGGGFGPGGAGGGFGPGAGAQETVDA